MRVFLFKSFVRFQRKENIPDDALRQAIHRAERGLIDADLGGGLIKQRIARAGKGRSSGYRVVIGYREATRAVFLLGFAKSPMSNVSPDELEALRDIGHTLLAASDAELDMMQIEGRMSELNDGDDV